MNYYHPELVKRVLGQTIRDWKLSEVIDEGASAVVFKGIPIDVGQERAIKVYSPVITQGRDAATIEERLRRQQKLYNHQCDYLVKVHHAGFWHPLEVFYVVMDHVPYPPYAHVRPIPLDRVAPLLAQVAQAAHYLEQQHFVHRDIKPANVLVSQDNRNAVLVDLGVIGLPDNSAGDQRTVYQNGDTILSWTMRYAPPEYLSGEVKDSPEAWRAVTFYQLGALLFEMLSGRQLFEEAQQFSRIQGAVQKGVSFENLQLRGSDALKKLCRACLQLTPEERLQEVEGWKAFDCVRLSRKPTVILLYAGGTIGSQVGSYKNHVREVRRISSCKDDLLERISARLKRESELFLPEGGFPSFELKWEVIQPKHQQFSENFTPLEWNLLARTIRDIFFKYVHLPARFDPADTPAALGQTTAASLQSVLETLGNPLKNGQFESDADIKKIIASPDQMRRVIAALLKEAQDRYIAGVIVLHGTDTLAYSASALAFSMRYFPFPVLLTGSNQPPAEKDIVHQDPTLRNSDAWRNLMLCLHFLRSFGHRYAELFVCFGDSIQHAINIRKTSIRNLPMSTSVDLDSLKEPFVFRNEALPQQYMFKCIEGLYCNNFYTKFGAVPHGVFTNPSSDEDWAHLRPSPFETIRDTELLSFHECVGVASLSPSSFSGFVEEESIVFDFRLKAVLIVGYDSGTIATERRHSFMKVIRALEKCAIPMVLVSRYGIVPSQEQYATMTDVCMLRLIGIIPETALALLTVVASQIKDEDWAKAKSLDARTRLLKRGILDYQRDRSNILTVLLGNVLDEEMQSERLTKYISQDDSEYRRRVTAVLELTTRVLENRQPTPVQTTASGAGYAPPPAFRDSVDIARGTFLLRELEQIRPYECAGSAPDELATVTAIGFKLGVEAGARAQVSRFPKGEVSKIVEGQIRDFFSFSCRRLTENGVAEITHTGTKFSPSKLKGS